MDLLVPPYQEDLTTPGSSPLWAFSRRQIRQIPKNRMYPESRPQMLHRLYDRVLNFGLRFCFSIKHFLAIYSPAVIEPV